MRTNNFCSIFLLLSFALVLSCSSDDTKDILREGVAFRPSIPIVASEIPIGTQIWMAKNLDVSRYRNGDIIPEVQDPLAWVNLTSGAWCYYANSTVNGPIYGKLYNAYAVNDVRGLAPQGWHIPSDIEWNTLANFLGTAAGNKLKSTTGWTIPNNNTNSSNFTACPGGRRTSSAGDFVFALGYGYCWTSTMDSPSSNIYKLLGYSMSNISTYNLYLAAGMSVRCVRD